MDLAFHDILYSTQNHSLLSRTGASILCACARVWIWRTNACPLNHNVPHPKLVFRQIAQLIWRAALLSAKKEKGPWARITLFILQSEIQETKMAFAMTNKLGALKQV